MKVIILAGGFATRLWPLTERRAKPLLLLDGKTILAHILEKIPERVETILLTNKKFKEDFTQELSQLGRSMVKVFCEDAHSDKEKLGALGAVSMAINHYKIEDNILVVAGDNMLPELKIEQLFCAKNEAITAVRQVKDVYEARRFGVVGVESQMKKDFTDSADFLESRSQEPGKLEVDSEKFKMDSVPFDKGDGSFLQKKIDVKEGQPVRRSSKNDDYKSVGGGVFDTDLSKAVRQKVISFDEKPEHPKSTLVSTGFFGIGKDLLPILHDFASRTPDNLGGVFSEFLAQGEDVYAVEVGGEWFDVGSFETYLEAHVKLQSQSVKAPLIKGGGGLVPKTRSNNKSRHDQNTYSGKVFIGDGAIVENCQITDSIIYPGVRLKNCIISQSVIDEGCDFEGLDLNRKLVRRGTRLKGEE